MGALEVKSPDVRELHFQVLKKKSFTPPKNLYALFLKGFVNLKRLKW